MYKILKNYQEITRTQTMVGFISTDSWNMTYPSCNYDL